LLALALVLGAGPVRAASPTKEDRAFEAAVSTFNQKMWDAAEIEFDRFALQYPASANLPEAWLLEAEAEFRQGKFAQCETLLAAHLAAAGKFADAYTYWIGEAQFQAGDWRTAETALESVPGDSAYALQATVEAEAALARLGEWGPLIQLNGRKAEVFQRAERSDPDNELLLRGRLLLAQAHFKQGDLEPAGRLLAGIQPQKLPPELEWQRVYLLCQVKLAAGENEAALPLATNLLQMARSAPGNDGGTNLARSVALHAEVLEKLGSNTNAIEAFQENISTNVPAPWQSEAILKTAALSIAVQQYADAELVLGNYVSRFTNAPAEDAALLALGELELHAYAAQTTQTNRLVSAQGWLDRMLTNHPNSALAGKAYLDLGWCVWLGGDPTGSWTNFQKAVQLLPRSEDLAVARFKLGDADFARRNYAEALGQYQAVRQQFTNEFPAVGAALGNRALYQSLRAQLQLGDLAGASNSMARIAALYPVTELQTNGAFLLLGQGYTDLDRPTDALAVFQKFEELAPQSPLRPKVDLAVARIYEQERRWPEAVAQYENWLQAYPTNELLAQALYARAWANYQAGNETNALLQFTNFVARFPTNELAPTAQWWVADHYFRLGNSGNASVDAELNYKAIFQNTNWQNSATFTNELYYPALMMAGRAAVARSGNEEAIRDYFQKMEADTNCPPEQRVQAIFAHGSALMKMDSPDTNNPAANFLAAVTVFNQIASSALTNTDSAARAWGEMGDCYLQLARYDDATNAYLHAMNSTNRDVQSQAQIGLGLVLEKKAGGLTPGPEQTALYAQALENCWDVLNRSPEEPEQDPLWTKKAGLAAAELATALGKWDQAVIIYTKLGTLMPELQPSLARKIEEAGQHLNPANRQRPFDRTGSGG